MSERLQIVFAGAPNITNRKLNIMKKSLAFILFLLSIHQLAFGQQETILTKYTFNSLFFNPAFAGSSGEDEGSLSLQYRNQWLGVTKAPTTYLLGAERSFFDHSVGLGATLSHEGIGVNAHSEAAFNANYRMDLGNESYLSGGLRTGFSSLSSDFDQLNVRDGSDIFASGNEQLNNFAVGAGLLYHDNTFFIGLSVPSIVSVGNGSVDRNRHIYGHASVFVGDEYAAVKWVPSLLIKYQKAVPLQITLGCQAWLSDVIAPGLHWRVDESIAASVEIKVLDDLNITAAYDLTTNELRSYSAGSMELMLSYRIGNNGQ